MPPPASDPVVVASALVRVYGPGAPAVRALDQVNDPFTGAAGPGNVTVPHVVQIIRDTTAPQITNIEILRPLEYLGVVRDYILGHHERWDGTGYPRGLTGDSIPLGSRILAVVDAWESMTTPRPFRAPRDVAEAAAELRRECGRQFDYEVVEAFLKVLEREGELREAA